MNALVRKLDKFDATVDWINQEKQLFNKEITPFQELTDIKVHIITMLRNMFII